MKLTKYEHACVVIEEAGQKLVIDPGNFTRSLTDITNVSAVVLTHQHFDHLNTGIVQQIVEANPAVRLFAPADTIGKVSGAHVKAVKAGDNVVVGPFSLTFFGEMHAIIHNNSPQHQNVGVFVNDTVYYPGDSFVLPTGKQPRVLLLPVSGPWLKLDETLTFAETIKAPVCIPTHEAMLSEAGFDNAMTVLQSSCEDYGGQLQVLQPGQSLEL